MKTPVDKFISFYFFELRKKFAKKQKIQSLFLISKDNISQSVDIFQERLRRFVQWNIAVFVSLI